MSICYHRYLSYPSNYISCKPKFKFTPEPLQWFLSYFLVFLICLLSAVVLVDQTYYYVMAGSDVRGCSEKQQQQYLFRDAHNMLCLVHSPQSRLLLCADMTKRDCSRGCCGEAGLHPRRPLPLDFINIIIIIIYDE